LLRKLRACGGQSVRWFGGCWNTRRSREAPVPAHQLGPCGRMRHAVHSRPVPQVPDGARRPQRDHDTVRRVREVPPIRRRALALSAACC